jgi:hypothetical protein
MKFLLHLVFFFSTSLGDIGLSFVRTDSPVLHSSIHKGSKVVSTIDTTFRRNSKRILLSRKNEKYNVSFKPRFTQERILAFPKGERPLPSTYLRRKYIKHHLRKFEKEGIASRIVSKNDFVNFGVGKPDKEKTEFVGLKSEIDFLLSLPLIEQANKLGIPVEQLQNGYLLRINFSLSDGYKVYMPSGNEFGANPKWIPGGKLPTGLHEAIIRTEGMKLNVHYFVTNL